VWPAILLTAIVGFPSQSTFAQGQAGTSNDGQDPSIAAKNVPLKNDQNRTLSGLGLIEKVLSGGPEPVFQADGYHVRINAATESAFAGELKTLADVGPNTWLRYEGKRDKAGVLIATKATFIPTKQGKILANASTKQESAPSQDSIIDADGNFQSIHTKVRLSDAGGMCGWHRVPADQVLQERVRRVGMNVVPAFQKQMAVDDPSKIHFRFYAVDDPKTRSDLFCNEGLILVPKQVVERLKSDDQLAAVLGDGVAYNLQRRSARLLAEYRALLGAETAGAIAMAFVPAVGVAAYAGMEIAVHKVEVQMQQQRGRVALSLMADGGYDPWQAPEAWRLLTPKHLPANLSALKFPARSNYQLEILKLQYKTATAVATSDAGR
jgi:hypothetical protein